MKKSLVIVAVILCAINMNAQQFFTKTGTIYFDANSPLEKIEATTNKGTAVIDAGVGKIEVKMLVKSFHFKSALMEEHFNENYMESHKFPQAMFVGDIADIKSVNLQKDGTYKVNIKGKLTMHNVTKDVTTQAVLTVSNKAITEAKANFKVLVADYGIAIPAAVKDKIAKEAKIDVDMKLQPLTTK